MIQTTFLPLHEEIPKTKSNEWYTPARYVEAARVVMGTIDLDPASCEQANKTVKATRYYSKAENGLVQPWFGRVWLNPPFSDESTIRTGSLPGGSKKGHSSRFVGKLVREYEQGKVSQAVLLVNGRAEKGWFQPLWSYLICFANHSVMFHRPGRNFEHHMFGTVFVYLGPHESRFIDIFSQFGTIARRVSPPRHEQQPLPTLWEHNQ